MARGLERPPWWAVVVMVVAAVALAVALPFAIGRGELTASEIAAIEARTEERRAQEAAASEAAEPARVLVIGDSYTEGSGEGGNGDAGWPAIVQTRLPEAELTFTATGGGGYVAVGPAGRNFPDLVTDAPLGEADIVVVFGSRNDGQSATSQIGNVADALYVQIREAAPDATLVVIGPPWVNDDVPAFVEANRDAIQAAAAAAGATFVDPLAEGWFFDRPDLIGADNVHPTDEGHVYLADRIEPVLRGLLEG